MYNCERRFLFTPLVLVRSLPTSRAKMIPKLTVIITLVLSLALTHPQYTPSEAVETGALSKSQCDHPSYDCVPYYQCHNGVINTDGEYLIDPRVRPQGTCVNSDFPDAPSICCLIPGQPATSKPLEICPGDNLCVDQNKCSADGYIVEGAISSLIDIRTNILACIKTDGSLGLCCTQPPPSAKEKHCSDDQQCVPWENCVDGVVFDGIIKSGHVKPANFDDLKCGPAENMCCSTSNPFPAYPEHGGNGPAVPLVLQCGHSSYDCVPYFQCVDGVINTSGDGLIDVRSKPKANAGATCSNPDYSDVPAVCCLIPGEPATPKPLEICPGIGECVDRSQCSADGFIVTDGAGSMNLRSEHPVCYTADEELGVCCSPPAVILENCPPTAACVDHGTCDGEALDHKNNWFAYSTTGKWSECTLNQYGKTGICCAIPTPVDIAIPPVWLPELLSHCPSDSFCTDQFQCLGLALDKFKIFVEYNVEGDYSYCSLGPSEKGVCCKQPPSQLSTCPSNSNCVQQSNCQGEAMNSAGTFVSYEASLPSWSLCRLGEFDIGLCCSSKDYSLKPASQCGIRNYHINQRIQSNYAKNEAAFGEFPWQSIIFLQNYTFKCGGSLISNRHVLTAAHCVQTLLPGEMKIRLGEWQVNSFDEPFPYDDYNVYKKYIHPNYNPKNVHNDIAILEIEHPIKLQYHINSVCIPSLDHKFTNGELCYTTGWGKDSFTGTYQHIMKKTDLPFVESGTCEALLRKTRLGKYFKLNKSFNCAGGEENKDACFGDGGGPLVCKNHGSGQYFLTGITSWGIECGLKDVPGVYVNVQLFKTWIDEIVLGFSRQDELDSGGGVIGYGK